jgi:hypothetical protein
MYIVLMIFTFLLKVDCSYELQWFTFNVKSIYISAQLSKMYVNHLNDRIIYFTFKLCINLLRDPMLSTTLDWTCVCWKEKCECNINYYFSNYITCPSCSSMKLRLSLMFLISTSIVDYKYKNDVLSALKTKIKWHTFIILFGLYQNVNWSIFERNMNVINQPMVVELIIYVS